MGLEPVRLVAHVAVEVGELRRLVDAPTAVVDLCGRQIDRIVADLLAVLKLLLRAIERTAAKIGFKAVPREAVLHRHVDGAAERVEPEDRVSGDDRHLVDRVLGNEVPVDGVAERLVDAHAVLIDGEADRRSGDRRRVEAAIADVWLEVVARYVADRDARRLTRQRFGDRRIVEGLNVLCARLPDREGRLRDVDLAAAERRRRDHVEGREHDCVRARGGREDRENDDRRNAPGDCVRHSSPPFRLGSPTEGVASQPRRKAFLEPPATQAE